MMPIRIIPQYRLVIQYDIRLDTYDAYYQFVTSEFVPALHTMGLYMTAVWHTAYGNYPLRQIEFVTDSLENTLDTLRTRRWRDLEERLLEFTTNYERKLIRYRDSFQF